MIFQYRKQRCNETDSPGLPRLVLSTISWNSYKRRVSGSVITSAKWCTPRANPFLSVLMFWAHTSSTSQFSCWLCGASCFSATCPTQALLSWHSPPSQPFAVKPWAWTVKTHHAWCFWIMGYDWWHLLFVTTAYSTTGLYLLDALISKYSGASFKATLCIYYMYHLDYFMWNPWEINQPMHRLKIDDKLQHTYSVLQYMYTLLYKLTSTLSSLSTLLGGFQSFMQNNF